MKRNLYKWLFFGLMAALFLLLPFLTPYHSLATEMLIFAIFAVGYDIVFGYTGLLSFGHAIFFGIGAYGTGACPRPPGSLPFPGPRDRPLP